MTEAVTPLAQRHKACWSASKELTTLQSLLACRGGGSTHMTVGIPG